MKALFLAVSAAALFATLPASASPSMMTIGGSFAEGCFEAAKHHNASTDTLRTCDTALAAEPLTPKDTLATHVNRGILRMIRKDYPGAEADFVAATAMNADRSEPWLNLATLRLKQGKSAEALPLFTKAIELGMQEPEIAYYGRGLAYESVGNLKAAYADLRRAAELRPTWSGPARELARYQVRRP
jgi:tetratricopeptide (TPR) repeat protein